MTGWGEEMSKASDTQVGGDHYKTMGDFQPWDVLQHWLTPEEYRGYQKGVAIAYLARERQKGGDQDIKKAAHHLQRLIEAIETGGIGSPAAAEVCCCNPSKCIKPCVPRVQGYADADGWITWAGGECPVPGDVTVKYFLRCGVKSTDQACRLGWRHDGDSGDIIAYRVVPTNG